MPGYDLRITLGLLNQVGQFFAECADLHDAVPDVLAIVARVVPLRSVILITETPEQPRVGLWHYPDDAPAVIDVAYQQAWGVYSYFCGGTLRPVNGALPAAAGTGAVAAAEMQPSANLHRVMLASDLQTPQVLEGMPSFLALPLTSRARGVFGVIQFATTGDLSEEALAFLNAVAGRCAWAHQRLELRGSGLINRRFLTDMSHEFRTPLNAILGFAELLVDSELSQPNREEYIKIIRRNGNSLVHMLDNLISMASAVSDNLIVSLAPVNLRALMSVITANAATLGAAKGLQFSLHVDEQLPELIFSDREAVQQIVTNLVDNAVKFSDRGDVAVLLTVGECGADASAINIEILVADQGKGIKPSEQGELFQAFRQLSSGSRKTHAGAGLGLALSRRLARTLGGDVILVHSAPGEGATFKVSLKALRVPVAKSPQISG